MISVSLGFSLFQIPLTLWLPVFLIRNTNLISNCFSREPDTILLWWCGTGHQLRHSFPTDVQWHMAVPQMHFRCAKIPTPLSSSGQLEPLDRSLLTTRFFTPGCPTKIISKCVMAWERLRVVLVHHCIKELSAVTEMFQICLSNKVTARRGYWALEMWLVWLKLLVTILDTAARI